MNKETKKGGLGFLSILALIFITLKLMGYITWSWWWVIAPLWGPLAVIATCAAVIFMLVGAATCWEKRRR
ncbi:hypothetical protein H8I91_11815 [Serratia fonticola]|uniref:hypothetical protein n=1 Tax=Serratia fonticola TaxID=47917 RepID=UPI001645122D|nr:hypothetical protein [Serratia fonticola]MBC3250951.1 hypothetical protein [Serratia fonticola]